MSVETVALLNAMNDGNFGAFREGGMQILKDRIDAAKADIFNGGADYQAPEDSYDSSEQDIPMEEPEEMLSANADEQ